MLKDIGKFLVLSILLVSSIIFVLFMITKQPQQQIVSDELIAKTSTPEQMMKHTYSGNIIEKTSNSIVIQNGDQEETYYFNENTKIQVGVVSDSSLDMIVPGVYANILAYNGVSRVIHVNIK